MDDRVKYLYLEANDSDVPLLFATKEALLRVTTMVDFAKIMRGMNALQVASPARAQATPQRALLHAGKVFAHVLVV